MKNGYCPKCESLKIYLKRNGIADFEGLKVTASTVGWKHPVVYDSYLCTNCGFFENYIVDKKKLSTVEEIWNKVEPEE
jgi:glutaredoxin-related protein